MLNVRPYTPALQKLAAKFDCGNSYLNQFLRSPDALDAGVGKLLGGEIGLHRMILLSRPSGM